MRRMGKNNRGFSVVELIIVVAILAAVVTTSVLSIGMVFSANAKTCTNDIINAVSECKIMTMSAGRGNVRLILYRDADGDIYSELQTRTSESAGWVTGNDGAEKIGARRCAVGSTDGADDLPTRDSAWEIYFNRSSGAFLENLDGGGTATNVWDIYVGGGSRNYHIHFEKLTGKITMELIPSP